MASTVGVNKLSIVNEDSSGISIALPDVCLTPAPPAPPIPIPYPNIAQSSDIAQGTKKVTAQGKPICVEDSTFSKSSGDDAGTAGGGVASGLFQGKAEFMNYSFDVQFEGKNVPRSFDLMLHNSKNTPPFPVLQGPVIALGKTASAPKKAEEPTPSASCDWCLIKLPSLGTKLKGGGSGEDVKKLHQHLKDFGFKVELSEFKGGKWQESDELSKGSWGPATARAVRMFAQHPKVKDEEEMIIGTSGAVVTASLGKKLAAWCDGKIQSPQNYWEYGSLNINPGDRDALGSKDDSTQQTVPHDFVAQIELDLGKTGFALHDDGLCGLKKPLVPKGEFLPIPRNADGKRLDTHLADMPHLMAKFQRQTQWPWRMKNDGSATDDAKAGDESSCVGDPTGIVDLATAKDLHHWASKDLHMGFKKFELTVLKWPPDPEAPSTTPTGETHDCARTPRKHGSRRHTPSRSSVGRSRVNTPAAPGPGRTASRARHRRPTVLTAGTTRDWPSICVRPSGPRPTARCWTTLATSWSSTASTSASGAGSRPSQRLPRTSARIASFRFSSTEIETSEPSTSGAPPALLPAGQQPRGVPRAQRQAPPPFRGCCCTYTERRGLSGRGGRVHAQWSSRAWRRNRFRTQWGSGAWRRADQEGGRSLRCLAPLRRDHHPECPGQQCPAGDRARGLVHRPHRRSRSQQAHAHPQALQLAHRA